MKDPLFSTKKVEEIILQEIPEGLFPHIRKDDLSTYINLLLCGEENVHFKKGLSLQHTCTHYTRPLLAIKKVLEHENLIPGFKLNNKEKKVLSDFVLKRLSGEDITISAMIEEAEEAVAALSKEKLLQKLVALHQEWRRIDEQLSGKTIDEMLQFFEKLDDKEVAGDDEDDGIFPISKLESIDDKEIRDLINTIWKHHKKDILEAETKRMALFGEYQAINTFISQLSKAERSDLLKRTYEKIEFQRFKELPRTLQKWELMLEENKKR